MHREKVLHFCTFLVPTVLWFIKTLLQVLVECKIADILGDSPDDTLWELVQSRPDALGPKVNTGHCNGTESARSTRPLRECTDLLRMFKNSSEAHLLDIIDASSN